MSLTRAEIARRARRRGGTPFLKPFEIHRLADKLHTQDSVVEAVLQVAGHVLRERYRRRGWLTRPRNQGVPQDEGVERAVVAAAIEEVT
jgi:hypothetical protein